MSKNRSVFDTQLNELEKKVFHLVELAVEQIEAAMVLMDQPNKEEAARIVENDQVLDDLELLINDEALLLIAKQQPVATDLRRLFVMVKSATDIERIADYASNIAKALNRVQTVPYVVDVEPLKEMGAHVVHMMQLAAEAYREGSVSKAKQLSEIDRKIDELNLKTIKKYIENIAEVKMNTGDIHEFANIARYLERMGDHVTNFGEHLIFLEKGKHYDLNQ